VFVVVAVVFALLRKPKPPPRGFAFIENSRTQSRCAPWLSISVLYVSLLSTLLHSQPLPYLPFSYFISCSRREEAEICFIFILSFVGRESRLEHVRVRRMGCCCLAGLDLFLSSCGMIASEKENGSSAS